MPRGSNHPSICLGADQVSEAFPGLAQVCTPLPPPALHHALQPPDTAQTNALSSVGGLYRPQTLISFCCLVIGDVLGPVEQHMSALLQISDEPVELIHSGEVGGEHLLIWTPAFRFGSLDGRC